MTMGWGDKVFGIHEQALNIHVRRAEILAQNLANVTTPHYKARDLDFKQALAVPAESLRLTKTHQQHLVASGVTADAAAIQYRKPLQSNADGNTVDSHIEYAAYAENTLRYLANVTFMNHRLQALNVVLSGGG